MVTGIISSSQCASRFMDSLEVPTVGYGIRYEFGIFEQTLKGDHSVASKATASRDTHETTSSTFRPERPIRARWSIT
jgi:glucan phosphorylase